MSSGQKYYRTTFLYFQGKFGYDPSWPFNCKTLDMSRVLNVTWRSQRSSGWTKWSNKSIGV